VLPAVAGAVMVVLAGLLAGELGGARAAQVLAGVAALCSPMLLGANAMLQTVSFDQLAWLVVLYLYARLLRTGDPRRWLGVEAAVGVGLEVKFTMLTLALGLAVGTLATPVRRHLATPWPWLGAGVGLALLAPNLVWQMANGWPTLEFLHHQTAATAEESPLTFLGETLLLVTQAKAYYVGPLYPLLLAAGAVGVEAVAARRGRSWPLRTAAAAEVVGALVAAPIALPVLPTQRMVDAGLADARDDWAEMLGWPALAGSVASAWDQLPPSRRAGAAIVATNYGEAGAIDQFGPALGLPRRPAATTATGSGPATSGRANLAVVGFPVEQLADLCQGARQVATLDNPYRVANEERGQPVVVCPSNRMPLRAWPPLRRFG
jgi:Dolichyl-phosphate-mannose-protein mannosyltransferase